MQTSPQRIALYARVSTHQQTAESQILELRALLRRERMERRR